MFRIVRFCYYSFTISSTDLFNNEFLIWATSKSDPIILFLSYTSRLNDGSKYLLRAPTEPLMKEWVTKLQQNAGKIEI